MARTRNDWETLVAGTMPGASTSLVAEWKLFRDLVITIAMIFESILELFQSDVTEYVSKKQYGSLWWYRSICFEFQNGDNLQVVDGIVGYSTINPALQIIKLASVKERDEEVLSIKVCKQVMGVNTPLTSGELLNFKNYISQRKVPGTKTQINSMAADLVNYSIVAIYDPLYVQSNVQTSILDALTTFKNTFRFDGVLYYSKLYNVVNDVPGVLNLSLTVNLLLSDGTVINSFVGGQELSSGYFEYDGGSSITLNAAN